MKRESQSDRILRVLRAANAHSERIGSGRAIWLTTSLILRDAGYCSFSARISELRARGFVIECRRIEGVAPGPDAQEYRLVESQSAAA